MSESSTRPGPDSPAVAVLAAGPGAPLERLREATSRPGTRSALLVLPDLWGPVAAEPDELALLVQAVADLVVPTVAVLRSGADAASVAVALAADVRCGATGAPWPVPVLTGATTFTLERALGRARARALLWGRLLDGPALSAEEALACGLAHSVDDDPLTAGRDRADALAAAGHRAAALKRLLDAAPGDVVEAARHEARLRAVVERAERT